MLMMRQPQMDAFVQAERARYIAAMGIHLRTWFPDPAWRMTVAELHSAINSCLQRAAGYSLHSQRDGCRYLNLAAEYGWHFDADPRLQWMHAYLCDETVSSPADRLDLLVKQCRFRKDVQRENLLSREALGPGPSMPSATLAVVAASDYLGPERASRDTPFETAITPALLRQRVAALPQQDEIVSEQYRLALPWRDDAAPLLLAMKPTLP